jgi:hypothetical protein
LEFVGINRLEEDGIGTRRTILGNAVIGTPHNNLGIRLNGMNSVSKARFTVMVVTAKGVIQNDNINSLLPELGQPLLHTTGRQGFIPKLI